MKRAVLLIIIVIVLVALGFILLDKSTVGYSIQEEINIEVTRGPSEKSPENDPDIIFMDTIEISSSGFSPKTLEIKKGDTVTFVNKGSSSPWPASAIHPTHTVYPNSNINLCGTSEEKNIFDACGRLGNGETFSFTFDEVGEWKYHDHLRPGNTGTIIVK